MSKSAHIGFPIRIILCLLIVLALFSDSIFAQDPPAAKNVRVIGTSKIFGANVATAREQAISQSLVSAIDTTVLDMLPIESLIKNFQISNQILYGNTGAFIQGYKVLAEQKIGKTYRVVVQASVLISALEEQFTDAGVVLGKKLQPAILFFVSEVNLDDELPRYWWDGELSVYKAAAETAMAEFMKQKGFDVIDPGDTAQMIDVGAENSSPDLNDQTAVTLGIQSGANIVVVGQSKVERTANIMGNYTRSFRATATVRALWVETGAEIATITQTDVAVDPNEIEGSRQALIKAGTLAGEALTKQIAAALKKQFKESAMVKVIVKGTRNLANFVMFRKALYDLSGVEDIRIREMRPDTSTLMVDYTGTPKALADALMLKTFETFGINISEVSEQNLLIEIVSK